MTVVIKSIESDNRYAQKIVGSNRHGDWPRHESVASRYFMNVMEMFTPHNGNSWWVYHWYNSVIFAKISFMIEFLNRILFCDSLGLIF